MNMHSISVPPSSNVSGPGESSLPCSLTMPLTTVGGPRRRSGGSRAGSTYAFRSLLDAGAILTFGSDWTVAPLDPIQGIYAAVTRQTIDGKNPKGWIPEQRISVEEALRCYTSSNAYAMFMDNEIGRILPGMYADLAVLSDDLFTVKPDKLGETNVVMTISGGKIVYEKKK